MDNFLNLHQPTWDECVVMREKGPDPYTIYSPPQIGDSGLPSVCKDRQLPESGFMPVTSTYH